MFHVQLHSHFTLVRLGSKDSCTGEKLVLWNWLNPKWGRS